MNKAYPSTRQSFGIVGLIILAMVIFAPLNFYLNGIVGKSISMLIYYVVSLTAPFIIFHFLKKKEEGSISYGLIPKDIILVALLISVTITIQWGIISPLANLIPMPEMIKEIFESLSKDMNNIYGLITVAIAAPILEELLFRGIILNGLLKRRSVVSSILISSFLFAIVHLNPWQFVAAMIAGIFLGWVYYRTKKLIYSIIIHFTNNFTAAIFLYLQPETPSIDFDYSTFVGGGMNYSFLISGCILFTLAGIFILNKRMVEEREII